MCDVLQWLPVRQQISIKLCYIVRSCVDGVAPVYLQELYVPKSHSINNHAHPTTVTSLFHMSHAQTDMAGEHLLWPAHSFGTSCRLLHEQLAPTHQAASNEHWRRFCSLEWASCCRSQHVWGTFLRGAIAKSITLTLS